MTVADFLQKSTSFLAGAGIKTARLDALLLLEDTLGHNRAYILAHPETKISKLTEVKLNNKIAQRTKHTPMAYIRGKTEFYGRRFLINKQVMVPRPETETIVDLLKTLKSPSRFTIIDVGTGSGCLSITAKLELPKAEVYATDISEKALKIALKNAANLSAEVVFYNADLLSAKDYRLSANVVLANLPYVPDNYPVNKAARHEPRQALYGGNDGLNVYRRLWKQITELNHKPEHVIAESLPAQHQEMATIAKKSGYNLRKTKDFAQLFTLTPGP